MISLNYTIFVQFVLFIILIQILKRILFEPVLKVLKERDSRTSGYYEHARSLDGEVTSKATDYEEKISREKYILAEKRDELRTQASKEVDKILEEAQAEAAKELEKLKSSIADEASAAMEILRDEVSLIAGDMAGKVLGRTLN